MERDNETRGMTLAAHALTLGLIAKLQAKGIFSPEDVDGLLESVLASFEQNAPDGPDVRVAREVLEEWGAMLSHTRPR